MAWAALWGEEVLLKFLRGIVGFVFLVFFFYGQFFTLYCFCYNTASVFCFGFLSERHVESQLLTRDQTHTLCMGRQRLSHWTTGKSLRGAEF